jgi:TetR/AcrR family transcriptional regulator
MNVKKKRRLQILETLATELESKPGSKITTATLAKAVGVSEAALYRHFASKAQMFEALIEFAEDAVFGLFNQIMREERDTTKRCHQLVFVMLRFAEKNPGIVRVLMGDILVGEHERLRQRVGRFFARIETQFKQVLREHNLNDGEETEIEQIVFQAQILLSILRGRLNRFVSEDFKESPASYWNENWALIKNGLF